MVSVGIFGDVLGQAVRSFGALAAWRGGARSGHSVASSRRDRHGVARAITVDLGGSRAVRRVDGGTPELALCVRAHP
jgi:hypothetical protein